MRGGYGRPVGGGRRGGRAVLPADHDAGDRHFDLALPGRQPGLFAGGGEADGFGDGGPATGAGTGDTGAASALLRAARPAGGRYLSGPGGAVLYEGRRPAQALVPARGTVHSADGVRTDQSAVGPVSAARVFCGARDVLGGAGEGEDWC